VNILVYTDNDLDGAGSALLLKWYFRHANIVIVETAESALSSNIMSREETFDHYDRIFVLDMALTKDIIPYVDREKFVVIDHHACHAGLIDYYKTAKAIIEPHTSCIDLLYKKFKDRLTHLTPNQLKLIEYIDQYDSYNMKSKIPLELNAIFNTYNRPKVNTFVDAFETGIREYSVFEKNSIKLYLRKFKEQIKSAELFEGKIKDYKVIATFANFSINEVIHYFMKKYKADIGIVVNKEAKLVSFRRSKQSSADVSILAKNLCNGGGSVKAAGGTLTEKFGELTKLFKPC